MVIRRDVIESQASGWDPFVDRGQLFGDPPTHGSEIDAQAHQHLNSDTLSLPDHPQQDVLASDVVTTESHCLT